MNYMIVLGFSVSMLSAYFENRDATLAAVTIMCCGLIISEIRKLSK